MRRLKRSLLATESQEVEALTQWTWTQPKIAGLFIYIANDGKRSLREGARLKRCGLTKGVFDNFLAYPSNGYHGLWLEMKRRKDSKISKEQLSWMTQMSKLGYAANIAYGWENGVEIILDYLRE